MGFMNRVKNFLSPEDDYYEEDDQFEYVEETEDNTQTPLRSRSNPSNVVPFKAQE